MLYLACDSQILIWSELDASKAGISMKIVFAQKYEERYPTNPVESPTRVASTIPELKEYEIVEPLPASLIDIQRVHGKEHIEQVKKKGMFDAASLSAGGAICAAQLAMDKEPAFALIRPPGHHASANRAWGLCFFNNMAIAIRRIRADAKSGLILKRILIIDIDLHFGDGTISIFKGDQNTKIVNPWSVDGNFEYLDMDRIGYVKQVEEACKSFEYEMVGISAGFDTYIEDWGGLLTNDDFFKIGRIIRNSAEKYCEGRRFSILEGGYHSDLRYNIKSFIKGFA
jgi:acetoin utilization deacetylase AcuC-like enzyme